MGPNVNGEMKYAVVHPYI